MNKLPPLIELRAFDAAARHLSFKKAASELGVTPTAISHQIRQLERYCGRALFRRRPRPLTLTEAGVCLFPIIRDGLETFGISLLSRSHTRSSTREDYSSLRSVVAVSHISLLRYGRNASNADFEGQCQSVCRRLWP